MIRKLYPEKAKEREEELGADDEGMSLVVKYDEELRRERRSSSSGDTDMASFCAGIFIAICSFVVSFSRHSYYELLSNHMISCMHICIIIIMRK